MGIVNSTMTTGVGWLRHHYGWMIGQGRDLLTPSLRTQIGRPTQRTLYRLYLLPLLLGPWCTDHQPRRDYHHNHSVSCLDVRNHYLAHTRLLCRLYSCQSCSCHHMYVVTTGLVVYRVSEINCSQVKNKLRLWHTRRLTSQYLWLIPF